MDALKNNLFGQLKSYGGAVQGAFEQRIARPLLAFKRDLSRASSATRTATEQPTTPLEIIDIETNESLKTLLEKVKNTFSSTNDRPASEDVLTDDQEKAKREQRHSSISALPNTAHRRNRFRQNKSVSFAENIEVDRSDPIVSTEMDGEFMNNHHEIIPPNSNDDEMDFQRHFRQIIRPRRMSIGSGKDLLYQDFSAEIVAYVLKHALRAIEKEDKELSDARNQEKQWIDLK